MGDINAVFTPDQRAAARLLAEDPAFKLACDNLQAVYYKLWTNSKSVDERERLHSMATVLHDVRAEIVYVRDHNKIDEQRIQAAAKRTTK